VTLTFLVEVDFLNNGTWTDITTYVEDLSITRGRTRETDSISPGTLTLTLQNSGGRFTPGNASGAYYPSVKVNRPLRVSVNTGTQTYLISTQVDSWTVTWEGGRLAKCTVQATDEFKGLARRVSQSFYAETVLDNPGLPSIAFYPLSESPGSTAFGDMNPSVNNPVAQLRGSKYGAASFSAGNGAGFLVGAPQATYCGFAAGPNPGTNTQAMTVIQLAGAPVAGGAVPPTAGPWTWGCWFNVQYAPAVGDYTLLYARTAPNYDPSLNTRAGVAILSMGFDGRLTFTLLDKAGTSISTSSIGSSAGGPGWHYVTASLAADQKTVNLFVDNAAYSTVSATALLPARYTWFVAGGRMSPWGESANGLNGNLANIEVYSAADTGLGNSIRYLFGQVGYYLAGGTSDRFTNLAQNYGFNTVGQAPVSADTGLTSRMANLDTTGQTYLALLQQITDTEQGVMYMRGDGSLMFRNRAYRVNQAPAFTLDNSRGDVNLDYQVGIDDSLLFNDYAVTRPGGPVVRVRDTTSPSIADNGVYTNVANGQSAPVVLVTTDPELTDYAAYKVATYSQPQPRTPHITVELTTAQSLWPTVVGVDIGTRITVTNLPPEASSASADYIIESVNWAYSALTDAWTLSMNTSPPGDFHYPILTLDDPKYGLLNGANALFY
jgi:hypothetical protein